MTGSSEGNNFIALISLILSAAGIIVAILLVREGREFLKEKISRTKEIIENLWNRYVVQISILLVVEVIALVLFVLYGFISINLAISLAIFLVPIFLMLNSLHRQISKRLNKAEYELIKISTTVNRLAKVEDLELRIIKEKWGSFLEQVSSNISLTAIHNVLVMTEPFAVNGQDIVVLVPSILEPSIRNLAGRLRDMEPILESIYGKPYKLVVHNAEDVN